MNNKNKTIQATIILLFLLCATFGYTQSNTPINIVNSASYYTNNLEYNTGEIFVVYHFGTNTVTSRNLVLNEDVEQEREGSKPIKLYPNPTVNTLYYVLPNDVIFESVEIYDQYQKRVYLSFENTKKISFENLPTGVYYIIFNKNNQYNYKVLKQ